ncbi:helix-turn-helix domain-containing protein [Aliamphritea spongicola]
MTFKAIAECHSLTLASQRVNKTQAAISIQLKNLKNLPAVSLLNGVITRQC